MSKIDYKWLWQKAETQWHSKTGLASALLFIVLVLLAGFSAVQFGQLSLIKISVIVGILVVVIIAWAVSRRIPKAKKNHVGVLLALTGEKEHEKERLLGEFKLALKHLISGSSKKFRLQIVELPEYHAKKIETVDDGRYFMDKAKCMFMLEGRVSVRHRKNEEVNVLRLNGMVRHHPIKEEIQKQFSDEFRELLPGLMAVPTEDDLFSFEVRAAYIADVAKYIIGVAAMYSGDLEYARSLFEDLANGTERRGKGDNFQNILARRLIKRSQSHS